MPRTSRMESGYSLRSAPYRQRPPRQCESLSWKRRDPPLFPGTPSAPAEPPRRAGRSGRAPRRLRSLPRPDRQRRAAPPAPAAPRPYRRAGTAHAAAAGRSSDSPLPPPPSPHLWLPVPARGCPPPRVAPLPAARWTPRGSPGLPGAAGGEVAGTYGGSAPGAGAAPLPASRHLGPPPRRFGARGGAARTALHSWERRMRPSAP